MINLTNEQLFEIEEKAAALMKPIEIAILLGLKGNDIEQFVFHCKHSNESDIYYAYERGRLQAKFDLQEKNVTLAKAGSPAAAAIVQELIKTQNI